MQLTNTNYHSQEANVAYMSVSQYKNFMACEAATMADLRGEYGHEDKEALLAGEYLHAWNEGTLEVFKIKNHDALCKKNGELYAPFKKVEEMIAVLEADPYCMDMLEGDKEVIITAPFAGAMWKIKIDTLNRERKFFTDLKSTRSIFDLQWSDRLRQKVSFIEQYDYMIQAAVYAEIERIHSRRESWLAPMLVAVSKEDPPDKAVISLVDNDRLTLELDRIEENMPRILAVKNGAADPRRCESCEYCRSTKKVEKIIHYMELGGSLYGAPGTVRGV